MNKEEYVSIEVAKLLKEKGYPQKYNVGTICRLQNKANPYYKKTREITQSDIDNAWCVFNEIYPTLYEAAKWLRETHNIHVMIGIDDLDWWYQLYDCSEDGRMEETNHFSGSVACQKSYEEALNNGIFDALQLI